MIAVLCGVLLIGLLHISCSYHKKSPPGRQDQSIKQVYDKARDDTGKNDTGSFNNSPAGKNKNEGKLMKSESRIEHYPNMIDTTEIIEKHSCKYSVWHSIDPKEKIASYYKEQFGEKVIEQKMDIGFLFLTPDGKIPLVEIFDIRNNPDFSSEIHINLKPELYSF